MSAVGRNAVTYILHYYPGNASLLPHMALREAGAAFELRLVDRTKDVQHSPDYLRLNPNGRIPVLVHGSLVLYETAAITLYLADQHPEDRKSTRLNSSHSGESRMPSSA